ncbi:MAG: biotin--[acetyl-CoA-carboxylase] ligase [Candidatus Coproplasma sp.]
MKTKIIELEEIDSTNEFCKRFLNEGDMIVSAKRQTGGRGTKGRSFVSDDGGVYLSVMKRYADFDFSNTFSIMINACVAVCNTLKAFNLNPEIKWANDVLVGGKKICGTLIENRLGADNVCISIVGIGLNVNNILPDELRDIATTMRECRGRKLNVKAVRTQLIKNLQKQYSVEEYKSFVDWFGQEVYLDTNGQRLSATALDVDGCGNLICNIDGEIKKISSAEMSLRFKCKAV